MLRDNTGCNYRPVQKDVHFTAPCSCLLACRVVVEFIMPLQECGWFGGFESLIRLIDLTLDPYNYYFNGNIKHDQQLILYKPNLHVAVFQDVIAGFKKPCMNFSRWT